MQIKTVIRLLGLLLMIFSVSMLPPALISYFHHDTHFRPFLIGFAMTFAAGFIGFYVCRHAKNDLKTRDGFLVVALFWFVFCLFAATPLMIADKPHDTLTDAMFESVSGFTTTGATVLTGVDQFSMAMRYYRQQLQFLGGMGIVVLAVAILPMLGIGGMQLYRAETPGPVKDSKLTPRIASTAKTLWIIYVGLNILCALSFMAAGMNWFDAIGESFATISTGGFSMHDSSFMFYNSPVIELIASFFMIMGAVNFSLHFLALKNRSILHYWRDEELRAYLIFLFVVCVIISGVLIFDNIYSPSVSIVKTIFNVVSLSTTTGFASADYPSWPRFIPVLIMFVALIGGCAASTSGGMKFIRFLLLKKQTGRELKRLIHPNAVLTLKFGGNTMPENILQAMWGFIAAYFGLFIFLLLALMATDLNLLDAFGALSACFANAGVGIGKAAMNFKVLNDPQKWILIFAMLAGRLEIFSLLVLFSPDFWRQ